MPSFSEKKRKPVAFGKPVEVEWSSFRRGLNLLLQDVELDKEESRRLDNLILKGSGVLTQRPGTESYFSAGPSTKVKFLYHYYAKQISGASGVVEPLAMTESGLLVKKSGASYSVIPGASYASGSRLDAAQIYNRVYMVSPSAVLRKYDGTSLVSYAAISTPSITSVTKSSGTSGVFTRSWRVSAESDVGETLASQAISLGNLPEDFTTTNFVTLSWTSVANAQGYVIYGRDAGNETFLTRVNSTQISFIDDGSNIPSAFVFPPEADFTAGPKAKYVIASKEKLFVANIENNPSRVMFSGGGPNVDKFHWARGGGYFDISKDDGEEITGIAEANDSSGRILIFKERSIYQVTLTYNSTLGIVEPTIQKISGALGCVSHKTIKPVENDLFFLGRRAGGGISLNSIGYEPNFTSALRTREISARIRPEMETISMARVDDLFCDYFAQKYWIWYPVGTLSMKCMAYDRERLAFLGPETFPNNPACATIFYDAGKIEHFLYGGDDGVVREISSAYQTDSGANIDWVYESKKEQVDNPLALKNLKRVLFHLKNVRGSVNVEVIVEGKNGTTNVADTFEIESTQSLAGWGSFIFRSKGFGRKTQASMSTSNLTDIIKYINTNKNAIRAYTIRITGSGSSADILAVKAILTPSTQLPSRWRV